MYSKRLIHKTCENVPNFETWTSIVRNMNPHEIMNEIACKKFKHRLVKAGRYGIPAACCKYPYEIPTCSYGATSYGRPTAKATRPSPMLQHAALNLARKEPRSLQYWWSARALTRRPIRSSSSCPARVTLPRTAKNPPGLTTDPRPMQHCIMSHADRNRPPEGSFEYIYPSIEFDYRMHPLFLNIHYFLRNL